MARLRYIQEMMTRAGRLSDRRAAAIAYRGARRSLPLAVLLGAVLATFGMACDATPTWVLDAGPGADAAPPTPDVGPVPDGTPSIFADVSISGCAEVSITEGTYHCIGPVPLEITLATLVPPDATSYVWDFGDGAPPSTSPAPAHRYDQPGTFQITLVVGGPFGTISPPRLVQVTVTRATLGDWCEQGSQCQGGVCLCGGAAEGCPPVLAGTCSAECDACTSPGVCADLGVRDATDLPTWRGPHCLLGCASAGDCPRSGFDCREVPTLDATGTRSWSGACLPDVLAEVGGGCPAAGGGLTPERCLSGSCLAVGLYGLCTDGCALAGCPSYAACVTFTGGPRTGEPLCLARCSASRPCGADPDLGCEAADPAGDLGFSVLTPGEPAGATYCAPRRCGSSLDCPSGDCDLAAGGFCRGSM